MAARDVIVSAFATPPRSSDRSLAQDLTLFKDPPIVITADPMMQPGELLASAGFTRLANLMKSQSTDGSILGPFLKQRAKGVEIKSVTLIGFSAGNIFLQKVLETPDANRIDGVIAIDGAVVQKLPNGSWYQKDADTWANFAALAAKNERLFVNAFTGIPAPSKLIGSTADSAGYIYDVVRDLVPGSPVTPAYDIATLADAPPPPSVTISVDRPTSGGYEKISRTWDTMPMPDIFNWGNCWNLYYGGTQEPDHIFMSRYAQRAIWKVFLAPRLNGDIHCSSLPVAGVGGPVGQSGGASCRPNKKIIGPDVYPTDSPWPSLLALGGGVAIGSVMGYWFGRLIG